MNVPVPDHEVEGDIIVLTFNANGIVVSGPHVNYKPEGGTNLFETLSLAAKFLEMYPNKKIVCLDATGSMKKIKKMAQVVYANCLIKAGARKIIVITDGLDNEARIHGRKLTDKENAHALQLWAAKHEHKLVLLALNNPVFAKLLDNNAPMILANIPKDTSPEDLARITQMAITTSSSREKHASAVLRVEKALQFEAEEVAPQFLGRLSTQASDDEAIEFARYMNKVKNKKLRFDEEPVTHLKIVLGHITSDNYFMPAKTLTGKGKRLREHKVFINTVLGILTSAKYLDCKSCAYKRNK